MGKYRDCIIDRFDGTEFRFLSNFYMAPVCYEGIKFPSSEHAYQAAKFAPIDSKKAIAKLKTAGECKRAGQQAGCRKDWDKVKIDIMYEIVLLKFAQNPELLQKLLETENAILIEGNTWGDKFWGKVPDRHGEGRNELGNILMQVRSDFSVTWVREFLQKVNTV